MCRKYLAIMSIIALSMVLAFGPAFAAKPVNNEAPEVTAFDVPATSDSPVPISTFTATDSDGTVAGYLVTESSSTPSPDDPGWSATAPATYMTASVGPVTLFAWAMDDKDAVSNSMSKTVDIPDPRDQIIADLQVAVASLQGQVADLQDLLQHFSRIGNDIVVTGANLHVVSGSGATDGAVNGLGNVIVGYNELRNNGSDNRNGSHNLVIGTKNNFISYGSFVGGVENSTVGIYSSVIGGKLNETYGSYSSILGGLYNFTQTYQYGTVSGGYNNAAIGELSSVSGGSSNQASGHYSSISGGDMNQTTGIFSSVSGGYNHHALGDEDWMAGELWQDK